MPHGANVKQEQRDSAKPGPSAGWFSEGIRKFIRGKKNKSYCEAVQIAHHQMVSFQLQKKVKIKSTDYLYVLQDLELL